MSPPPRGAPERRRLDSWKEIAAHLGRTVRTVQRWERDERLPVHRHHHQKQSSIYAFADELDAWWLERQAEVDPAGPRDERDEPEPRDPAGDPPSQVAARAIPRGPWSRSRQGRLARWISIDSGVALLVLVLLAAVAWAAGGARGRDVPDVARPDADALYREGREHWNARTPRGFDEARQAFDAAIAADPGQARAHAGLADTYSLLEAFGLMAPDVALPRARAEAERALQLDPDLGEAHASLAFALWELRDTAGAMSEVQRAIELDPGYATAHHWHALFLQQFKRRDDAIAEARTAVELDPSRPILWTDLALLLRNGNRRGDAEGVLRDARVRFPAFPDIYAQLSDIALEDGDIAEAVTLLRSAIALGDNRARLIARLGCLEGTTGNPAGAAAALQLLRDVEASGQHVSDDAFAMLLAWAGDLDGVFRHVRRGIEQRQEWVGNLYSATGCWAPARHDPRWPELVAELKRASWLPPASRLPTGLQ